MSVTFKTHRIKDTSLLLQRHPHPISEKLVKSKLEAVIQVSCKTFVVAVQLPDIVKGAEAAAASQKKYSSEIITDKS